MDNLIYNVHPEKSECGSVVPGVPRRLPAAAAAAASAVAAATAVAEFR